MLKFFVFITMLCCSALGITANAETFVRNDFEYSVDNGSHSATVLSFPNEAEVEIPSRVVYNGTTYQVTAVFFDVTDARYPHIIVSRIHIPATIQNIYTRSEQQSADLNYTLEYIIVDINNAKYKSHDGLLYEQIDSEYESLLYCPRARTSAEISPMTKHIAEYAFARSDIKNIKIPDSVTSIGESAFKGSEVVSVTLPDHITTICPSTFSDCKSFETINWPKQLKEIGGYAFCNCHNLKGGTSPLLSQFPPTLEKIGSRAFDSCGSTRIIKFPSSIKEIGAGAFDGCYPEEIHCNWTTPPSTGRIFPDNVISNATLYVPSGSKYLYENTEPWLNFWNIQEYDDISRIKDINTDMINNSFIEYYDIQGRKINNAIKGIVIKVKKDGIQLKTYKTK